MQPPREVDRAACTCYEAGRDPLCPVHGQTAGEIPARGRDLTTQEVKVLTEDIPKRLAEETHEPWTGEPKSALRVRNRGTDVAPSGASVSSTAAAPTSPEMKRWEIGVLIGPCSESEAETLMEVIADLPEVAALGGVVSCGPWTEDE